MKENNDYLMISGIQHFRYCPRQWALIHVEDHWEENGLTAAGRAMHDRVHEAGVRDYRQGIVTIRGMRVHSDRYRMTGICDAVELIPDEDGISLTGRPGTWRIRPVEYKHGKSKTEDCDRLQVTAQAICLEEMLGCQIMEGDLFYGETRHREHVLLTDDLRQECIEMAAVMWKYLERGYTPKVKPGKKCGRCSMHDICMSELLQTTGRCDVTAYIRSHLEEGD